MVDSEQVLIDEKDRRILNILLENAKRSYRDIAKKARLSAVTVMHRVERLVKRKVIQGYEVVLDYEALGFDTQAVIQLRIAKGKLFEVEKKIAVHPSVFAVYDMTGEFDALVIAKFRSRKSLDAFLKKIQTYDFVIRTETRIILNTIKEKNIKI